MLKPRDGVAALKHPEMAETLQLPGDRGFNVDDVSRFSKGATDASGRAGADGTASARVELDGEGEAWTEFEVGELLPASHAGQSRTVEAVFRVHYRAELMPGADQAARFSLALKAVVLNSAREVLGRQELIEITEDVGARNSESEDVVRFTIELDPELAYQFLVAGRLELSSRPDAPAQASLDLEVISTDLELVFGG